MLKKGDVIWVRAIVTGDPQFRDGIYNGYVVDIGINTQHLKTSSGVNDIEITKTASIWVDERILGQESPIVVDDTVHFKDDPQTKWTVAAIVGNKAWLSHVEAEVIAPMNQLVKDIPLREEIEAAKLLLPTKTSTGLEI